MCAGSKACWGRAVPSTCTRERGTGAARSEGTVASAGHPASQVLTQSCMMTQDTTAPLGTERGSVTGSELFLSPLICLALRGMWTSHAALSLAAQSFVSSPDTGDNRRVRTYTFLSIGMLLA